MPSIKVFAPAKINLGLKIGQPGESGLHDLASIMQTIDLEDELQIEAIRKSGGRDHGENITRSEIRLELAGLPLASGPENLVYQAAEAWLARSGLLLDLSINLHKNIPLGAGLGGGSSDAAATLLALNQLFPKDALKENELCHLAQELGSDVPFFLYGGLALVSAEGEKILPLEYAEKLYVLLIKPDFNLSTTRMFQRLDQARAGVDLDTTAAMIGIQCLDQARAEGLLTERAGWSHYLKNDFEALLRQECAEIAAILDFLEASPAFYSALSGSGPSCYALFQHPSERDLTLQQAKEQFPRYLVLAAEETGPKSYCLRF